MSARSKFTDTATFRALTTLPAEVSEGAGVPGSPPFVTGGV
jgi:hypothetical protein